ncbi:MAG: hypothetical protein E3J47_05835 [Candidatus Stahlbacteria bacterium]|nr:MAG: hypothetical protein E3J47_05835 [Candidatus Stahlbacteria bacterium]
MKVVCLIIVFILAIILFSGFGGCSRNVDNLKANASKVFKSNGFEAVGYQHYSLCPIVGGEVWYTLKKGDITYQACVYKWFDEYHLYGLEAIDAIKP